MRRNPIILLTSCAPYRTNGFDQVVRDTWLKRWGHLVDHRFVVGRGCTDPKPDELIVDADDGYQHTAEKQQATARWALDAGYTHLHIACSDTYTPVPRLMSSGYAEHEAVGCVVFNWNGEGWLGGGCGYWLGPKAAEAIANENPPTSWAADCATGDTLRKAGIPMTHDARYWTDNGGGSAFPYWEKDIWQRDGGYVSVHMSSRDRGGYDPKWMVECHESFLKEGE
jgi:hypothetical protein